MLQRQNGGFTLVEVLVALFVLAVGVVGAAATGLGTMRLRQQAALESEAAQLAASLGARMRVNPAQMALPDTANPYLGFDYDGASGEPAQPPEQCFGTANCDSAQLAQFDLYETARVVHDAFPGGRIVVCRDRTVWNAALGALDWDCADDATAPVVVKLGWRLPARAGASAGESGAMPFVALAVAR